MDTDLDYTIRLRRSVASTLGLTVYIVVASIAYWQDYFMGNLALFVSLHCFLLLGSSAFTLAVYVRWPKLVDDAQLTYYHTLFAISTLIVLSSFMGALRPMIIAIAFLSLLVGSFTLRPRQYLNIGIVVSTIYIALLTWLFVTEPARVNLVLELVVFTILLVGIAYAVILSHELSLMRTTLKRQTADLTSAYEEIKAMANTCELTGLYNRRYLVEVLAQQKAMADRGDYSFAVCFVDLDYFKSVNDRFGHSLGDRVLRAFADVLLNAVREVDYVARVGGEEFVLVLAAADTVQAEMVSKRVRELLLLMPVTELEPSYRITASIGVTNYQHQEDTEVTLSRADGALYNAKNQGRDRIITVTHDAGALA